MTRIALFQPDIPQNTGTIIRTAACLGAGVDLIEPLGFVLSDKRLKRAGMDYVEMAHVVRHPSWQAFMGAREQENTGGRLVLLTTGADTPYTDFSFAPTDTILLGSESSGVPDEVHSAVDARLIIPMLGRARSLNVAIAGAMVLGEALRQASSGSEKA